jgi:hypothetical protein
VTAETPDALLDGDELRWAYLAACERGDDVAADRLGQRIDWLAEAEPNPEAHLDLPGAIGAAALYYVRHGLPVFPLKPNTKEPLAGSRGFLDATRDEEQVLRWWAARPEPNVGVPTGVLYDVVDIDGWQGHLSITTNHVVFPVVLGRVRTIKNGGWHYLVPTEPGRTNRAGLLPGVDIRSHGGYVVAPPSRINGRRYRWVDVPEFLRVPAGGSR